MKVISCFLFACTSLTLYSQNFMSWQYNDRYFSLQAGTGKVQYQGELKHNLRFQEGFSLASIGLEARLLSHLAARTEVSYFYLTAADHAARDSTFQRQRNLSFHSGNVEASLLGVYFLRKYRGDYYKRWGMDPYLMAGVGGLFFNPKARLNGREYLLHEMQTEETDYRRLTVVFPMGIGFKFRLNDFLNFNVEGSYRFTLTDFLDDVSTTYPDTAGLTPEAILLSNRKDEVGIVNQEAYDQLVPGNPRGDSSDKDKYIFLSFRLEFFLPQGWLQGRKGSSLGKTPLGQ